MKSNKNRRSLFLNLKAALSPVVLMFILAGVPGGCGNAKTGEIENASAGFGGQGVVEKANDTAWISLFDGKSLDGWTVETAQKDVGYTPWKVIDGVITANTFIEEKAPKGNVWLQTVKAYTNFELRFKVRLVAEVGNSGIQVRSRYNRETDAMVGPQIDINSKAPGKNGLIFESAPTIYRWIYPDRPDNKLPGFRNDTSLWTWFDANESDQWNDMRILCQGTRIQTWLNGRPVADYDGAGFLDDEFHRSTGTGMSGHIALQIHSNGKLKLEVKDMMLREL